MAFWVSCMALDWDRESFPFFSKPPETRRRLFLACQVPKCTHQRLTDHLWTPYLCTTVQCTWAGVWLSWRNKVDEQFIRLIGPAVSEHDNVTWIDCPQLQHEDSCLLTPLYGMKVPCLRNRKGLLLSTSSGTGSHTFPASRPLCWSTCKENRQN